MKNQELLFKLETIFEKEKLDKSYLFDFLFLHLSNYKSKEDFILNRNNEISSEKEILIFKELDKIIKNKIPFPRILNKVYFYKREFDLNKSVFMPRQETELLVETAIKELKNKNSLKIVECGTGTGIIPISLNLELKNNNNIYYAFEQSKKALKNALGNNKKHNTSINFINLDFEKGLSKIKNIDVLVSNPPYIDKKDKNISDNLNKFDPRKALYAKKSGLYYYEFIINNYQRFMSENFIIIFEIGYDQKDKLEELLKSNNDINYEFLKDINNNYRTLIIKSKQWK